MAKASVLGGKKIKAKDFGSTHHRSLNRSVGGDICVYLLLFVVGVFMALPLVYTILQYFKPLDELWIFHFLFSVIVYSLMFNSTVTAITMFITMSLLKWIDTYYAIIVPAFCTTFGLYLMRQFMDTSVPNEVLESARLEGAGELRIFWKIAMPMVKPAWITLIIFAFNGLWNTGASIYIYSEQLKTFNYAISQIVTGGIARSGASSAAQVISMIVPIVVFAITQSNVIQTMSSSGLKD